METKWRKDEKNKLIIWQRTSGSMLGKTWFSFFLVSVFCLWSSVGFLLLWFTLVLSNTMWHFESKMSLHECVFLWKPISPTSPPISSATFIRKTTWFSHFKALADSGCWHKLWCIVHKACVSVHVYVWHNFSDEEQACGKMLENNSYNHRGYVWIQHRHMWKNG